MKKILVLCTGNSCRSQMVHGYLQAMLNAEAEVFSAGVETHGVNPTAVMAMAADNIDISHHTSNSIEEYMGNNFDFIITVCDNAKERCPIFPGNGRRLHHSFMDPAAFSGPKNGRLDYFIEIRNEIKVWCEQFVRSVS